MECSGEDPAVSAPDRTVFLVDIDNTLLDNDRIQADLKRHLEREFGAACRDRYWAILEQLFDELGYRDYLGEYLRRKEAEQAGYRRELLARIGQPSNYGMDPVTLARHIRQLRRQGWQSWEIRARFFGAA